MNIEEKQKAEKLFAFLISIGFNKSILPDTRAGDTREDLTIFRHEQFYREQLLAFPTYGDGDVQIDYGAVLHFLDIWGYLDDNELKTFRNEFVF